MWQNSQFPADLITFTEEILSGRFSWHSQLKIQNIYFVFWNSFENILS